jgi:nitroimidazol reductase NimA-like FMN-containing flavoprotein (pyridoxamine 5'-phosphate oxidase superfamily)
MAATPVPQFRELDMAEIESILGRNNVGRLAYCHRGWADIEPIHYVYADGSVWGRTAPGMKLASIAENYHVAFEVDEIESLFQWRSVVLRGVFYRLSPTGSAETAEAWERAVELVRSLVPETLTAEDPVPFRWVFFRIGIEEIRGRAAQLTPTQDRGR